MQQYWKAIILAILLAVIGIIYTYANGVPLVAQSIFNALIPALIFMAFYIFYLIITKVLIKPKVSGISIEQSKFIFAMHLLHHHGINLFSGSGRTYKDAKYLLHIISNRFYPSPGDERWVNRVKIGSDDKHFDGQETFIMGIVDGLGMVTDDNIMNPGLFMNKEIWRDPGAYFMKGPSKTNRPRSLQDMIARHVEETGEIPEGMLPSHVEEGPAEKKEEKKV